MNETIQSTERTGLSTDESASLKALVALMIPDSAAYQVPGADDEEIFAGIVSTLGRDANATRQALHELHKISAGKFVDLAADVRLSVANRFRQEHPALAEVVVAVTTRCYYRDDRVMRSLGMEVRPPFPVGFEVEQGDWSLLDPVRARGKIYRDVAQPDID